MPRDSLSLPSLFFLCVCVATNLQASMREKFESYASPALIQGSFESPEYNQLRTRGMGRDMIDTEVISLKSPEARFTSGRGSGKYKAPRLTVSAADPVPSFLQKRKRHFSSFEVTNDDEEEAKDTPVSVAVEDFEVFVNEDGTYEDFPAATKGFNSLTQERIKRNRTTEDAESSASSFEDSDDDEKAAGSQKLGAMKAGGDEDDAEGSTEMLPRTFWKETARFWDAAAVYRSSTSSTPTLTAAACKRKLSPAMSSGGSAFNGIRISPEGNMMAPSPFVSTGLSPDGGRMGISPANPFGHSPAAIDGGVSFPPKISESRVNPSAFRLAVPVPVMGSSNLLNSRLSTSGSPVRRSSPHVNLASLSPHDHLGTIPRSPNGILNPIKDEQEDDYESELDFELDFEGFVLCDIGDDGRIKGGRPI